MVLVEPCDRNDIYRLNCSRSAVGFLIDHYKVYSLKLLKKLIKNMLVQFYWRRDKLSQPFQVNWSTLYYDWDSGGDEDCQNSWVQAHPRTPRYWCRTRSWGTSWWSWCPLSRRFLWRSFLCFWWTDGRWGCNNIIIFKTILTLATTRIVIREAIIRQIVKSLHKMDPPRPPFMKSLFLFFRPFLEQK